MDLSLFLRIKTGAQSKRFIDWSKDKDRYWFNRTSDIIGYNVWWCFITIVYVLWDCQRRKKTIQSPQMDLDNKKIKIKAAFNSQLQTCTIIKASHNHHILMNITLDMILGCWIDNDFSISGKTWWRFYLFSCDGVLSGINEARKYHWRPLSGFLKALNTIRKYSK